ncbi:unnamed protein product [Notodromas monacha]|uniref:Fe2OG dioxygenase domain-containing protein n=1 Tax=Notodromas monacha TaxID=399045 RepID=A0A7R9C2R0_9CRUS|nr:unnamed protein product [Notodromas monacha]CAG0924693.1 unnamed protein product [Notodromas monacha]
MNKTAVCPFLECSSSLKSNVVPFGSYSQQDTEFSRFRGIQIVFCATDAILLRTKVLQKMLANHPEITLFEMGNEYLCKALDNEGIFIFSTSLETFGHMIHSEDFKQGSTEGELYELVKNPFDWRQRYLHPEFELYLNGSKLIKEPCPDVYWFPLMTERYCKSIIREFETFGFWGNGSEEDPRNDGHEPVPTVDVYFTDMGLHETWMQFLRVILFEMVQKVYRGFSRGPPESAHTFLVRYQLGEQTYLRSHEDTAIYTINIAMNPNSDFTGAGLRFSKSECFIPETEMGWGLLHPSRLTHNHEAKPIRSGKRYVQVSFIDNE